MFLKKSYTPPINENRLGNVSDVVLSRSRFFNDKPSNLIFLLENRYLWMNKWVKESDSGIEVGCGNGVSKVFIKAQDYLLTDYSDYSWIEKKVDALNMPFENESKDFIISSNMIHHLSVPSLFFKECHRVLKPGGKLIIQEVWGSFFLRLILRLLRHEGYDFNVNPFDENSICVDNNDLWKGNNVIPNLLFSDIQRFEQKFNFKVKHLKYTEFAIFLISGGVTAKAPTINLPRFILKIIFNIDKCLIKISRNIFALQVQIVIQKT